MYRKLKKSFSIVLIVACIFSSMAMSVNAYDGFRSDSYEDSILLTDDTFGWIALDIYASIDEFYDEYVMSYDYEKHQEYYYVDVSVNPSLTDLSWVDGPYVHKTGSGTTIRTLNNNQGSYMWPAVNWVFGGGYSTTVTSYEKDTSSYAKWPFMITNGTASGFSTSLRIDLGD